jgi:hypothetical protein
MKCWKPGLQTTSNSLNFRDAKKRFFFQYDNRNFEKLTDIFLIQNHPILPEHQPLLTIGRNGAFYPCLIYGIDGNRIDFPG